jgi:hypothetical protein
MIGAVVGMVQARFFSPFHSATRCNSVAEFGVQSHWGEGGKDEEP